MTMAAAQRLMRCSSKLAKSKLGYARIYTQLCRLASFKSAKKGCARASRAVSRFSMGDLVILYTRSSAMAPEGWVIGESLRSCSNRLLVTPHSRRCLLFHIHLEGAQLAVVRREVNTSPKCLGQLSADLCMGKAGRFTILCAHHPSYACNYPIAGNLEMVQVNAQKQLHKHYSC